MLRGDTIRMWTIDRAGYGYRLPNPSADTLRHRAKRALASGRLSDPAIREYEQHKREQLAKRLAALEPHGTFACYQRGCRCDDCKRANAVTHRAMMLRTGRTKSQYDVPYRRRS